jgi:hypothetical protein
VRIAAGGCSCCCYDCILNNLIILTVPINGMVPEKPFEKIKESRENPAPFFSVQMFTNELTE